MSQPSGSKAKNLTIAAATPDQIAAACQTLFAHFPVSERAVRIETAVALFRSEEFDCSELLLAWCDDVICGAGYVHVAAGAQASVWPPRTTPGWESDRTSIEAALAEAYLTRLHSHQVKIAQLLLTPSEHAACLALLPIGFRAITQLTTLRHELRTPIPTSFSITLEPASPDERFGSLLLATYEATLDCPELNGLRTAVEVMAGYQDSGTPRWYTIRVENEVIGVVILVPGGSPGELELSYIGLLPSARGQGYGRTAVTRVMALARTTSTRFLTVTVDVRNEPALKLYEFLGFHRFELQDVYLWIDPELVSCEIRPTN